MNSDLPATSQTREYIDALLAENAELRAENERLRDVIRGATGEVEASWAERGAAEAELAEVRARLAAVRSVRDLMQREHDLGRFVLNGYVRLLSEAIEPAALASAPTDQASDEACEHGNSSAHWVPNPVFGSCGEGSWCRPAVQPVEAPTPARCEHGQTGPHETLYLSPPDPIVCPGPVSQSEAPTGGEQP